MNAFPARLPRCAGRLAAGLSLALAAAACTGDRFGMPGPGGAPQADPAVARPVAPPVPMAGRWTLQSEGRQCTMNFGQTAPAAAEGTVAPGGGCPGQFFTTRKWTYDSSGLLLSNHNSEPLARLTGAGAAFSGTATAGATVTLGR